MKDRRETVELDITSIERRERHLWVATLLLLLVLTGVTIVTFAALVDSTALERFALATSLPTALGGLLVLIALFCVYALYMHSFFARIRRDYHDEALRDPLTGLLNRHSFQERFELKATRARREERPLALILCDLDGFKEVNDSLGHLEGDSILRRVAQRILDSTRGSDLVFRWGGDEFLVLVLPAERQGAIIAARRIRSSVRKLAQERDVHLDVSMGIAYFPDHAATSASLISQADRALYKAKKSGYAILVSDETSEPGSDPSPTVLPAALLEPLTEPLTEP